MSMRTAIILPSLFALSFTMNVSSAQIIPPDRITDWDPGIPGGIPDRTIIFADVTEGPYFAAGDGNMDDTDAIQAAIDDCPVDQVVYFPTGIYAISSTLTFSKGIVLRGDGPASTTIRLTSSGPSDAVLVQGSGGSDISDSGDVYQVLLTGGYTKDSTTITMDTSDPDESLFSVGKYVFVGQSDGPDREDFARGDCTWAKLHNDYDDDYVSIAQIVRIESRDSDTVTISPGLYLTRESQYHPFIARVAYSAGDPDTGSVVVHAGIEDMKIERSSDYGGQGSIIKFIKTAYCWVRNVETYMVSGRHIKLEASYGNVIRDSYWHEAFVYESGGESYGPGIRWHSSATLIENNIGLYLNSAGVSYEPSGGGNVVAYNFFDSSWLDGNNPNWQRSDCMSHCSNSFMDLVEGNYMTKFHLDNTHGSSSYYTLFRNWLDTDHTYELVPGHAYDDSELAGGIRIERGYYTNISGNVIGQPTYPHEPFDNDEYECFDGGSPACDSSKRHMYIFRTSDAVVYDTTLRHGNFDYHNEDTVWDQSNADHDLPDSYYLTEKPAFFECRPWPPVGPDLDPMVGSLPARDRFDGVDPCPDDTTPPYTTGHDPAPGETGVSVDTVIIVQIQDDGYGVDQSTVEMTVGGSLVEPVVTGTFEDYTLTYTPATDLDHLQMMDVTIDATDLAGNVMTQDAYSFETRAESDGDQPPIDDPDGGGCQCSETPVGGASGTAWLILFCALARRRRGEG